MNFKAGFMYTLGSLIAKDVYEFVTEVGCRIIYDRHGDKLDALRKKWHEREKQREFVRNRENETIIGFRA